MKRFEYEGEIYYYKNNKFYDAHFLEIDKTLLKCVATAYFKDMSYRDYTELTLPDFLKQMKDASLFDIVIEAGLYGLDEYNESDNFVRTVLPILTSAYRMNRQPNKAINLANEYINNYWHTSVALYTSLAAAYCDVRDYENALKYAKIAYGRQGDDPGYPTELSLVFERIKNEMNK